ncbi:MAG TPA: transporter [Candidatus Angelobacter sp.]|nr:transporter [Candidatus Angelobacter sp.]
MSKWTKLAAAGALSLCTAVQALAGSVTQPGETVGLNVGAPLPQGWYVINTVDWGCRNTNPQHTCTGLTIPVVAWSTPWTFFGGRFQLLAAWPAVEVGVQRTSTPVGTLQGDYFNGMYNPAVFGQLAWDLGYGWGFSYLLGAYFDYSSPVAFSDTSLNQRFALSYTANDWAATANVIWGIHTESVTDRAQLSPCPASVSVVSPTGLGCNPNFINIDLTVGRSFGKWQVAWVGFGSSDLNSPVLGYQKQSQFATGGLLGYDFGPVVLQGYLTTDVYEKNYGGRDIRGWARVILPLNVAGAPFGPSPPPATMVRGSR